MLIYSCITIKIKINSIFKQEKNIFFVQKVEIRVKTIYRTFPPCKTQDIVVKLFMSKDILVIAVDLSILQGQFGSHGIRTQIRQEIK